jgi:hypothetical protein
LFANATKTEKAAQKFFLLRKKVVDLEKVNYYSSKLLNPKEIRLLLFAAKVKVSD